MADAEHSLPLSKKRAAGREISRDDPGLDDDDDTSEHETGTFKKASEEVLATRRIVKARRHPPPAPTTSNPFASIRLVPPVVADATAKAPEVTTKSQIDAEKNPDAGQVDEKVEGGTETEKSLKVTETNEKEASKEETDENEAESDNKENCDSVGKKASAEEADEKQPTESEGEGKEAKKDNNGHGDSSPPSATTLNSFQQLSSNQNAFTGIAGTGFSSSSFSFGSLSKEGSAFGSLSKEVSSFGSGSGPSFPSFNFGKSDNGGSSLFGSAGASNVGKSETSGFPSMQEVPVETGEENEKAVFAADAVLFEYIDGGWKERGKGEIKVNVATTGVERARLVMRARGNLRLILNASLFPDMKLANMDKRGVTFACMNTASESKDGLVTFALKFKDGSVMEEFRTAVTLNKGKKPPVALKTPENSPKASD